VSYLAAIAAMKCAQAAVDEIVRTRFHAPVPALSAFSQLTMS
jgi:hypothetical protein